MDDHARQLGDGCRWRGPPDGAGPPLDHGRSRDDDGCRGGARQADRCQPRL